MTMHRFAIEEIRRGLLDRAEDIFREVWGPPRNPNAARWRPARKRHGDDPRRMVMHGAQRGLWFDSMRVVGGDLLDLYAIEKLGMEKARADFRVVIGEVARWLGTTPRQVVPLHLGRASGRASAEVEDELAAVLEIAEPLAGRALSYWTIARNLDEPPSGTIMRIPQGALTRRPKGSILPYAEREAVLVLGRDRAGNVRAFQRIILERTGIERDRSCPKFSLGPIGTYPPFFAGRKERSILVYAEGPESAGAMWSATGSRVLVCGGAMARRVRELPPFASVILAVEADAPDNPAWVSLVRSIRQARAGGAVIGLVDCGGEPGSGFDAGDLIRQEDGRHRLKHETARIAERVRRHRGR